MAKSRLSNLTANEVSVVPRGANKKKFLLVKEGEVEEKILDALDAPAKGEEVVAGMSTDLEAQTVMKTAYRLFSTFKEKLTPESLAAICKKVGINLPEPQPQPAAKPLGDVIKALAEKVGTTIKTLAKSANVSEKNMKSFLDGEKPIEGDAAIEGMVEVLAIEPAPPTGQKSIYKADGSLNEDMLPAEGREVIVAIHKDNKNLRERIEKEEGERKQAQAITKADEFKNIGFDAEKAPALFVVLKDSLPEESYNELMTVLKTADDRVKEGGLFTEHGRNGDHGNVNDPAIDSNLGPATKKVIEKANRLIEKDKDGKLELGPAITKVLSEDPKLYAEYSKETAIRV